jgi:hypothetical protein
MFLHSKAGRALEKALGTTMTSFSLRRIGKRFGYLTAEAPFDVTQDRLRASSKDFFDQRYSELCELGVSAVNVLHT